MRKIRIAVLVSGGGTNLQALIDAQKTGIITSGEIVLVVSNKSGVYALERAKNAGIKAVALPKSKEENTDEYETRFLSVLKENNIEMIVLAGFLRVLSKRFVDEYPSRIINIHPSLIPDFCGDGFYGLKVHEAVLAAGVKETGATVHFVNEITDGGLIIMQKHVKVEDGDTPEILQRRVMEQAEWIILPEACEKVSSELLLNK